MKKRLSTYFAFMLAIVLSMSTIVSPVSQGNIAKAAEIRTDTEETVSALDETGESNETEQVDMDEKTNSEEVEITTDVAEEIQTAETTDTAEEMDIAESTGATEETQVDIEVPQQNNLVTDSTDKIQETTEVVEEVTTAQESENVKEEETLDSICAERGSTVPDYDIWLSDMIRSGLKVDGTTYGNSIYEMFLNMQEPIYAELGGLLLENVPLMSISSVWHDVIKHEFYDNQKLIYETLIMDYMKYKNSESSSKFDISQIDRANSYLIDIFGELSGQYLEEGIYNWKPEEFLDLSVEDASKSLKRVESMKKAVDSAGKVVSNTKELLTVVTNMKALEDAKEERIQMLRYARNACAAMPSPNSDFIQACDEIIVQLDNTVITADYVVNKLASDGIKEITDKAWDELSENNPVLKAIDLSSGAMDILFSTSDNASNNLKLSLLYTMDCYFKMGLSNVSTTYQSNPISENAMAFNGCFEGYLDFQMYGNSVAKSWISEVTDGGVLNHAYTYIFHRENLKAASELKDLCDSQNATRQNIINLISKYQDMYNRLYVAETYQEVLDYKPTTSVEENIDDTVKISDGLESSLGSRKKLTDSGKCGENVYWKLYEDTLIIYGSGDMANYHGHGGAEWDKYDFDIKFIIISSGVTSIGSGAFYNCESLREINVPEGLTSIGNWAFCYCSSLRKISLPESLISIGRSAFEECSSLGEIGLPKGLMSIGRSAFFACSSLKEIVIPKGVTSIGEYTFYGCNSLKKISILNKNCEFSDERNSDVSDIISKTATIYGYTNSTAEAYAKKYNRKFQALDAQSSNTYTITYNANGGKNAPSTQKKQRNKTLTLSKEKPKRTGYTFLGWATSKSSTKATYTAGASFKENKNTTLYAVWKANTYKIAFDKNGGTGSMTTISCTYGKNYTLTANTFKRKGYTFKGWNTKADGTGSYSYSNKATVKNVSSVNGKTMKLYAQWIANKYKIAFDKNGGTGSMTTISCTYGKNYTLAANMFKRTGYTFKGWNTKADGTGSYSYANKATVKNVSSVNGKTMKLYAQWTAKKYNITYQLSGGTNNKANPTSYKVTTATITLKNPTRKGYTFSGWYTSSSYKTKVTKIVKGSTGNKTLYARWKKSSKA